MKKQFLTDVAIIKMARPENGALAFAAVWIGALIGKEDLSGCFSSLLAFSAATALILSAGNGINDVFDFQIDTINRPERPLPSGRISKKTALLVSSFMMAGGLCLAWFAGFIPALIAFFAGLSLVFYSIKLKYIPLAGNILIGLLTSLTFISGGIIAGEPKEAIVPAVFAFFFTVSREIFKDIQDEKGDKAAGIRTAPITWGIESAWLVAGIFLIAGVVYSPVPYLANGYNLLYLLIMLAGVDFILVFGLFRLGRIRNSRSAGKMQLILKYDIIIGFAAIVLGKRF